MALTQFERKTAQETAHWLQSQGYNVDWEVQNATGDFYDLVARRGEKGIVYEFTRQSHLAYANEQINKLRQQAKAEGYADFRLVVVPDATRYEIKIEGLEHEILAWVQEHPLDERAKINKIFKPAVEAISAQSGEFGMRIQGVCGAQFVWRPNGEEYDCPLNFDLQIGLDWKIQRAFKMHLELNELTDILPDEELQTP